MKVREATLEDLDSVIELFESTIRTINTKDYSPAQIEVWANAIDKNVWSKKIIAQYFYVAEFNNQILGFSSMDYSGYLDFMYTHKDFQGKGIAKSLLQQIEKKARELGIKKIFSSVSITAQLFFTLNGFSVYDKEFKSLNGASFINSLVQKQL